ncbi:hypothetical protein FRC12_013504 [Ceratobasidium sp. 428]|nr:hypothetical protein FRC12_013504 [Ceratobasidium sp. 428]
MKLFRDRMRAGAIASGTAAGPTIKHQRAQVRYLDLINNPSATSTELRDALAEATSTIDGREARIAILETELETTKELARERRNRTAKGGRLGQARVYTQEKVQELAREKEKEKEAKTKVGRGRGRGRGVARGQGRGIGQGRGRGRGRGKARSADSEYDVNTKESIPSSASSDSSD